MRSKPIHTFICCSPQARSEGWAGTTQTGVAEREEDAMDETSPPGRPKRRWGRAAGFLAAGIIAGGVLAGTVTAGAQSNSPGASSLSSVTATASGSQADSGETLLAGTTAQKVRTAALGAVPGGTIL